MPFATSSVLATSNALVASSLTFFLPTATGLGTEAPQCHGEEGKPTAQPGMGETQRFSVEQLR